MGLRVVASDGGRAGWRRAVVRYVITDLGFLLLFAPSAWRPAVGWLALIVSVGVCLPILFDPMQRGLHDRAAGTVVVRAS